MVSLDTFELHPGPEILFHVQPAGDIARASGEQQSGEDQAETQDPDGAHGGRGFGKYGGLPAQCRK